MEGEGPTYKLHNHVVLLKLSFSLSTSRLSLGYSWISGWQTLCVYAVAKFIVHDWGDKVDSGIGLSSRTRDAT
jgi:hypothetical protein